MKLQIRMRAWGALAGVLAGGIVALGPASPASAEVVPRSQCASYGDLGRGQCFDYGGSAPTWLGTYKSAGGDEFFCIDKDKSAALPADAPIKSTAGLTNQYGEPVGERAIAAINYIVWRWGDTDNNNRAAAIHLITREVMSDTGPDLPSGLGIGENVKPPTGMASSHPIMQLANEMWDEARLYHGNWKIGLGGDASSISVGESRAITATVTSRNGFDAPSLGVPGQTVSLTYAGGLTGPASAVTGPDGVAHFSVTATVARQQGSVSASIDGPAKNGKIFDPTNNALQRGWIPKMDKEAASLAFPIVVKGVPTITTVTSDAMVEPGQPFYDRVLIEDAAPTPRTAVARLYGPYDEQPTAADCQPSELAREVTFEVTGSGVYETPTVTVDEYGYYVWTEHLPGDGVNDDPATTPCGIVEETTLVNLEPKVATKVSAQSSKVFEQLFDTIVVTGMNGHPVTAPGLPVEWTLYGPLAPVDGSCENLDWADAAVLASGTVHVTADGEYKTPTTTVPATGCYSYGEELLQTPENQPYEHPVGHVTQTTLTTKSTPQVRTITSDQVASVGGRLFDRIKVTGVMPGDTVQIDWTLYGPKKPKKGKCKKVNWSNAKVFDSGSLTVTADGTYKTRKSKKLKKAGCYTYAESIPENGAHTPVLHEPGKPSQTTVVTKTSKPKIPTGFGGFSARPLEQLMPWW